MRITMMCLESQTDPVRVFSWCDTADGTNCRICLRIVALEHPVQTLQLNTRLSNKSWVSYMVTRKSRSKVIVTDTR